jgi:hypothetical protein
VSLREPEKSGIETKDLSGSTNRTVRYLELSE